MAQCPNCKAPGAYIGFNSIECHNPKCVHFVIEEEDICPCCGKRGHVPGPNFKRATGSSSPSDDPADPADAEGDDVKGAPF